MFWPPWALCACGAHTLMCVCTHVHTYMHTYMHVFICIRTQTHTHKNQTITLLGQLGLYSETVSEISE